MWESIFWVAVTAVVLLGLAISVVIVSRVVRDVVRWVDV